MWRDEGSFSQIIYKLIDHRCKRFYPKKRAVVRGGGGGAAGVKVENARGATCVCAPPRIIRSLRVVEAVVFVLQVKVCA